MAKKPKDHDEDKRGANSKKEAPDYYVTTGQLGGRRTLETQGSSFFSKIAKLRHKRNRDSRTAAVRTKLDKPK